jgi:protein-S-isoprenylcysteine O-methyltransferase Ste14
MHCGGIAGREMRALSLIAFALMGAALAGLIATGNLFASSLGAIAVQLAALALSLWARLAFGVRSFHVAANPTEGSLVRSGPYRFVRHPIYAAVCLFAWAGALANRAPVGLLFVVLLTAGAVARILCEEALLVERYPEYRDYARGTKRLVPFVF